MYFVPIGQSSPRQGRLVAKPGQMKKTIVDDGGIAWSPTVVAYCVPDDEPQGEEIRACGYRTHSPMSQHLGPGSTNPGL